MFAHFHIPHTFSNTCLSLRQRLWLTHARLMTVIWYGIHIIYISPALSSGVNENWLLHESLVLLVLLLLVLVLSVELKCCDFDLDVTAHYHSLPLTTHQNRTNGMYDASLHRTKSTAGTTTGSTTVTTTRMQQWQLAYEEVSSKYSYPNQTPLILSNQISLQFFPSLE